MLLSFAATSNHLMCHASDVKFGKRRSMSQDLGDIGAESKPKQTAHPEAIDL